MAIRFSAVLCIGSALRLSSGGALATSPEQADRGPPNFSLSGQMTIDRTTGSLSPMQIGRERSPRRMDERVISGCAFLP